MPYKDPAKAKERTKTAWKQWGAKKKAAGYCTQCGKKRDSNWAQLCNACHDSYKKHHLRFRRRLRTEMISAYGGCCTCCGETRPEFLTIDHINGGGTQQRILVGRGAGFYAKLKRQDWPKKDYQLLCMNCNLAKAIYKVCPHESERKQQEMKITG